MTSQAVEIPGYLAAEWVIDPAHSHVGFTVRHFKIAKVRGHFTGVTGRFVTAPDPLDSQVTATIEAGSISTGNADRDAHLRSPDFFDAGTYPELTYRSTGLRHEDGAYFLDGDLTIKGITRAVTLAVELHGFSPDLMLPDPAAAFRIGLSATGSVRRTDFGVGEYSALTPQGVAISDQVTLTLEIEAAQVTS